MDGERQLLLLLLFLPHRHNLVGGHKGQASVHTHTVRGIAAGKKNESEKKTPEKSVTIVAAAIERNKAKDMLL